MSELEQKVSRAYALAQSVPFGQSRFQNVHLVDDSYTPERRLRHVLLQLDTKVRALKSADFNRRRLEVKLQALRRVCLVVRLLPWIGELVRISIEEREFALELETKLVDDAWIEVETFVAMLEDLPKEITREQFERAERTHWVAKLTRSAELEILAQGAIGVGTLQALEKLDVQARRLEGGSLQLEDLQKNKQ